MRHSPQQSSSFVSGQTINTQKPPMMVVGVGGNLEQRPSFLIPKLEKYLQFPHLAPPFGFISLCSGIVFLGLAVENNCFVRCNGLHGV